jgi:hypothetical protein
MIGVLSLIPLFRGVTCGLRISELFQQFRYVHEARKTVKTVRIEPVSAATQLKLGVNETLLSNSLSCH